MPWHGCAPCFCMQPWGETRLWVQTARSGAGSGPRKKDHRSWLLQCVSEVLGSSFWLFKLLSQRSTRQHQQ